MAMGKANFPKNKYKLHSGDYGVKPPEERYRNKLHDYLKMTRNKLTKWRRRKKR